MSNLKRTIFISIFLVASISASPLTTSDDECKGSRTQKVTFWETDTFSGDSQSFCRNVQSIQSTPGTAKLAQSFCVERGVWIVYGYTKSANGETDLFRNGILVSGNIGELCISLGVGNAITVFTSVKHLASVDYLDRNALSLYDERWRGVELFLDGTEARLPRAMFFDSFAISGGNDDWTVYSKTDFTGDSCCLRRAKNDPYRIGVGFSDSLGTVKTTGIGSIRQGCSQVDTECQSSENFNVDMIIKDPLSALVKGDSETLSKLKATLR